jgi:hypothetical protein
MVGPNIFVMRPPPLGLILSRLIFDPEAFATTSLDQLAAEVARRKRPASCIMPRTRTDFAGNRAAANPPGSPRSIADQ